MHGATYILTYNEEIKEDVTSEMLEFFRLKISELHNVGLKKVIVDPGFGFSKTLEQNYQALNCISTLHRMGYETLVGVSRKSMIYKVLHCTPQEALNGTTVLHTLAVQQKADWLRVHDVKEAAEVVRILETIKNI
jgi:dihydropteroate synthase